MAERKVSDSESVDEHFLQIEIIALIISPVLKLNHEQLVFMVLFHDFGKKIFGDQRSEILYKKTAIRNLDCVKCEK